ncbi:MAG: DUF2083 domain-containing protein [Myxococcales bacterium]|nr:DUF2083 domain-containing protein [Myxococcales bacterium]
MVEATRLGGKVRALRRRHGLTQARMAERLQISPSYLNLIEHDKRPLTAAVLIRLMQVFDLDPSEFSADGDARMVQDLMEVFGDALFEDLAPSNHEIRELVSRLPTLGNAILRVYRAYAGVRDQHPPLPQDGRLPSDEVTAFVQRHQNYFPSLESAAAAISDTFEPDREWEGMVRAMAAHGVKVQITQAGDFGGAVRHFDPQRRRLSLSEVLPPRSRAFHLAVQLGLVAASDQLDELSSDPGCTTEDSRRLLRVVLAGYFAGAVLMPYQRFLTTARQTGYDIELLGHRFRTSFEQVCHRLCSLYSPEASGIPFHFTKIDTAGNISKQFSVSGLRFARFGGACPRWNVAKAFLQPNVLRIQVSAMPDGERYFTIAKTMARRYGGFGAPETVYAVGVGCRLEHASELVYARGMDLAHVDDITVPIGTTCRLCERRDCDQRAFPSVHHPLRLDENVRGVGFYASTTRD